MFRRCRYCIANRWLTCLTISVFLCVASQQSAAQSADVFLGMRGGLTNSSSPLDLSSNHYFPPIYSSDSSPYAWGPTVGVILNDKFEVRLEAARYGFHIDGRSGFPYPASGSKWTSVTDGHVWQYPLLIAYRVKVGSLQTFLGGGLSLRTVKGTTTAVTTTIRYPNPEETTTVSTGTFSQPRNPIAFHYSAGLEFRKGWISLRPEWRIGFWTGYRLDSENQTALDSTQTEFIVGIRAYPFSRH